MILTTDRLILRRMEAADTPAVVAYRQDPRVDRYQCWRPADLDPKCLAERCTRHDIHQGALLLAITRKEDGALIGDCSLAILRDPDAVVLGYSLEPKYQRQGYALEAARSVCQWVLAQPRFSRVIAAVDPENVRSIALLEKLGMSYWYQGWIVNARQVQTRIWWYQLLRESVISCAHEDR